MSWCKRACQCKHCLDTIETGKPVVVGRAVLTVNGRKTYTAYRWHPNCWVGQALAYIEQHPFEPPAVGRKRLELDSESRDKRLAIMRRHAATLQRIRYMVRKQDMNIDAMINLGGLLAKQAEEIEQYGGVPESWK